MSIHHVGCKKTSKNNDTFSIKDLNLPKTFLIYPENQINIINFQIN